MEAYLSEEALQSFSALRFVLSSSNKDGILLGHKRGHRFFVERILPTQRDFFPSQEKFLSLIEMFENRLLGFFSFQVSEKKIKKILAPFAYGKLFLHIELDKKGRLVIKPFIVEHEIDFFLSPIKFRSCRQRKDKWIIP